MKKRFKSVFLLAGILVLSLCMCTACGGGSEAPSEEGGAETGEATTVKIALEEVQGDPEGIYAEKFKEILEEKSNGAYNVEIYYLGQLGDGTDQVELCQNGMIEMTLAAACATGSLVPESNVFGVHYLFPDTGALDVQEFLDNSKGVDLVEEAFAENNLVTLDWTSEGYNLWCTKEKVTTPEEMKGFAMRTMPAPVYTAFYSAYGANCTTVAFSETYSALQLNMVSGVANPIAVDYSTKYHEVSDYLIDARQDLYIFGTFVNSGFWDGLSPEDQQMFQESAKEASDYYNNEYLVQSTEELTQAFIDSGVEYVELTDEERQAFKDIAMQQWGPAYGDAYGERAAEILALMQEEIAEFYGK
ncbi:MAG: TRAP transporter substrate-binding protein DctP [Bacillota bacterium]|jgi:C4-dicarboxylate-binding protein DctP